MVSHKVCRGSWRGTGGCCFVLCIKTAVLQTTAEHSCRRSRAASYLQPATDSSKRWRTQRLCGLGRDDCCRGGGFSSWRTQGQHAYRQAPCPGRERPPVMRETTQGRHLRMTSRSERVLGLLTNLFPLYVILGSITAATCPSVFAFFKREYISPTLSVIMLAMGLTLSVDDFVAVLRVPDVVLWGALAQYSIMPLLGWMLSRHLGLPTPYAVGMLLVSSCPGGTASNLVCYLAGANVALSVLMTATTTQAAVILTPLLMKVMAGTMMPVDACGMFLSMVQVVFLPLAVGMLLNAIPRTRAVIQRLLPWFPLVSVAGVVLINASIISGSVDAIRTGGLRLFFALLLLHGLGLVLGYVVSFLRFRDKQINRAVAIEVCMQNSGLGAALAQAHFADPQVAVPAAISASMHSVIGSVAAGIWRWLDSQRQR